MENLRALLHETMDRMRGVESDLEREHRGLGEELLGAGNTEGTTAELKQLLADAKEIQKQVDASEASSGRLRKLLGQLSESKDSIEEKEGELSILGEEIEPHYERVGHAAAEALVDDDPEAAPYRRLLDQLRTLEGEIKELNKELSRVARGEEEKGIVNQAISGGRKLYQQGLLKTKVLRVTGLYRRLGREVCESDLLTRMSSPSFMVILEPVLKNKEEAKKVRAQLATLRNKAERVQTEINSICENERPQRRMQRLEQERARANDLLSERLVDAGSRYADRPGTASTMPKKVKARLEEVRTVRKESAALAKRKERLEAAIALETVERKVDSQRAKLRNLENSVKRANREIAGLSEEIKELNEEREKLLRVRGEIEDLQLETVGKE